MLRSRKIYYSFSPLVRTFEIIRGSEILFSSLRDMIDLCLFFEHNSHRNLKPLFFSIERLIFADDKKVCIKNNGYYRFMRENERYIKGEVFDSPCKVRFFIHLFYFSHNFLLNHYLSQQILLGITNLFSFIPSLLLV